ncbi:FGGY-family carbohydrate kinase [Marinitenerispora sediminis]|uniref:Sugar kinase n=1 Tax=Marinitenerispora sediminis TaxID=1931232 RepID=A0A368T4G7_9ACTN|nr:FGGY-family carbohydrate kinase [Marinitenerispora sediminis]RCV57798.1 sugar kinase [Marinitenerispora sediminis]RCV58367.1 sugar kinase [Marinitenerispora sediminis]RCV59543.1 sugar kinase [Marinitenerispora sediminis]
MSALLAIDLGTESARVAVYTDDGRRLGQGESGYPTDFPRPGWAEQNPEDWWRAVVAATRTALDEAGRPDVDGVAVATTASTVTVLDRAGRPLRPALLWMDSRADAESARTAEVDHPVLRYAGGSDAVEWLVPKAMWLAGREPAVYRAAARITEAVDYLVWRLTGEWTGSRMNAVCKWNYDPRGGGFPEDLYAELGVPDLRDKLPDRVAPVGAPVATMHAAARAELGVTGTAVVSSGGIDAHLSLLAVGGAGEGRVSIVCGTSNAFVTEMAEPVFPPTVWGPYPDALNEGRWLVEGGQVASGSVLKWAGERLLGRPRADLPGLIAAATAVPAAGHGLLVLDYFMGNRTPLRDPRLRGAVLGLTVGSTPEQVYRAAVEGVAYGTRQVLDSFVAGGVPVEEVFVSGGIRHNPLWLRTTADVLGRPLRLVAGDNLSLRACSVIAAVGAGHYPSLGAAAADFAPETRTVEPDAALKDAYEAGYADYRAATTATRDVSHRLSAPAAERTP